MLQKLRKILLRVLNEGRNVLNPTKIFHLIATISKIGCASKKDYSHNLNGKILSFRRK